MQVGVRYLHQLFTVRYRFLYFHVFANRYKKGVKCLRAVFAVFARYGGKENEISPMMSLGPTPESDAKYK